MVDMGRRNVARTALVVAWGLIATLALGCATTRRTKISAADRSKLVQTTERDGRGRRMGLETREGQRLLPTRFERVVALSARLALACVRLDCDLVELGSGRRLRRFEHVRVVELRGSPPVRGNGSRSRAGPTS